MKVVSELYTYIYLNYARMTVVWFLIDLWCYKLTAPLLDVTKIENKQESEKIAIIIDFL